MANEEHLAILKQGVKAWNQWREAHRDIRPDLSGGTALWDAVFLAGTTLVGTNLAGIDLSSMFMSVLGKLKCSTVQRSAALRLA
jgi:hypothetical protein